jgi:starch phosphorylase
VWLNTPLKPFEASGTSGMKAGMNGALNLSIMDGWWPECYNGENGWAIKSAGLQDHSELRDSMESNQIYDLLEEEISPLFYERDGQDIPREWVARMKKSICMVCKSFNINRMLKEYSTKSYHPAAHARTTLLADDRKRLKEIIGNMEKVRSGWDRIQIREFITDADRKEILFTEDHIHVECSVYLDEVDPALLEVQLFYLLEEEEGCEEQPLRFVEKSRDRVGKYEGDLALHSSGVQSFGIRVVPADRDVRELYPDLVKWRD